LKPEKRKQHVGFSKYISLSDSFGRHCLLGQKVFPKKKEEALLCLWRIRMRLPLMKLD
jgi:hypothetical protein